MAEAASSVNPAIDRYNRYYQQVLAGLQQSMGPQQTDSQLKNYLSRILRPSYDQAILQRQQQTGQANAAIDADAASRGMGTSTWVTDAKARQQNSEAADVAALNSNYNSSLYDALLSQIQQREANRMNLMGQAQNIAGSMYDVFKKEDPERLSTHSGGVGGIDSHEYYAGLQPHSQPHRNPAGGTEDDGNGFGDGLTDSKLGLDRSWLIPNDKGLKIYASDAARREQQARGVSTNQWKASNNISPKNKK